MYKRLLLVFALLPLWLRSEVVLSPLFSDHAVLQQAKPVPIWGHADAGEKITVSFRDQTVHTTAGPDGRWIVYLEPLAPGAPAELTVTGKNTVKAEDVVVGEVWLCSGQSNMEFIVGGPPGATYRVIHADEEMAAAKFPLIRQFNVKHDVAAQPTDALRGSWVVCSPEAVKYFTAVGYFFARDIHQKLNVPIGLIDSTWGGTPIESWMSPAALTSNPAFAVVHQRWEKTLADYPAAKAKYDVELAAWEKEEAAAKAKGEQLATPWPRPPVGPGHPYTPSVLFNGMINPLLPYGLRGVLWYQGESNAGRASEYHALFSTMITTWRQYFGQGDLPFYWVQLPNFDADGPAKTSWAFLREAQAQTLSLPDTGMAVTIDIGDNHNIHPRNKQEVGRRLALIACDHLYHLSCDWSGPVFKSVERDGSALRVSFVHAEGGLVAHEHPLSSFQIAGADRKFYPGTARIDHETVVVSAPEVPEPVAVRYAWINAPDANLYNGAGLPAAPFRSDHW